MVKIFKHIIERGDMWTLLFFLNLGFSIGYIFEGAYIGLLNIAACVVMYHRTKDALECEDE